MAEVNLFQFQCSEHLSTVWELFGRPFANCRGSPLLTNERATTYETSKIDPLMSKRIQKCLMSVRYVNFSGIPVKMDVHKHGFLCWHVGHHTRKHVSPKCCVQLPVAVLAKVCKVIVTDIPITKARRDDQMFTCVNRHTQDAKLTQKVPKIITYFCISWLLYVMCKVEFQYLAKIWEDLHAST